VYFIFQLDLDTQLQRALNYEAYEQAKEVRAKRERVDEAVGLMRERKAANVAGAKAGDAGTAPALSAADYAAEGLTLRTAMARAVEKEDYKEAGRLKALLGALEAQAKKAASVAESISGGAAFAPRLRLGQRVVHSVHGYRGVVVGWDAQCCESEEWVATSGAAALPKGTKQPYYHVLVERRDWEYDAYQPPVAYVAQEQLWAPEFGSPPPAACAAELAGLKAGQVGGDGGGDSGSAAAPAWVELFGKEPLEHPYMYILFLGQDARGDFVPCRQLRDKYAVQRRDVFQPGSDDE